MIEAQSKERIVRQRYAAGAKERTDKLCCPIDYDSKYLEAIPPEVIERDYGCGDPSRYVREGETVLDLGSGTGKICFIAAQIVGPKGKVIGVDMTDEMLEVARRNAPIVAERIGYANVEFRKGRIQDLALDLELLDRKLKQKPITDAASFLAADELAEELRAKDPLIASDSIGVVVSNCVLNLVEPKSKRQLFDEIFRVLKKGGRAVISDVVSDEEVPEEMQNDPELWSGCISGAFTEEGFLAAFEKAGFSGIQILKRDTRAWRTVQGIEFHSITIEASKGEQDASSRTSLPHSKETKSQDHDVTKANNKCCDGGSCF
jgi:arsenite methyltransferase